MGYTHYFRRPQKLNKSKFKRAALDCDKIVTFLSAPVQYEIDDDAPAVFSASMIRFNGVGDEGHETFLVQQEFTDTYAGQQPDENRNWFSFCKTARKPYDASVCACLIVLQHYFGRNFRVSSDGNDGDEGWAEARKACQEVLGYGNAFTVQEGNVVSAALKQ